MRVLLLGAGGVGSAIAKRGEPLRRPRPRGGDRPLARPRASAQSRRSTSGGSSRARSTRPTRTRSRRARMRSGSTSIVNACDPRLNPPIFAAAFDAGCHYLDMAMTLSEPHPDRPYEQPGRMLGEDQFAASERWRERGLLALVGMGVEPGLSDVFARYAADHLFARDRRDRRARRRRSRGRRLRLRADVLDLDDTRGVPQSATGVGTRARVLHAARPSPSRRHSCSPRGSARSSACTWSTRRCC